MSALRLFNEMFVPEVKRCNAFLDVREVCDQTFNRKNGSYLKILNLHYTSAGFILTVQPLKIFPILGCKFVFLILFSYYLILVADVLIKTEDWVYLMTQMWKWFQHRLFSIVVMDCTESFLLVMAMFLFPFKFAFSFRYERRRKKPL